MYFTCDLPNEPIAARCRTMRRRKPSFNNFIASIFYAVIALSASLLMKDPKETNWGVEECRRLRKTRSMGFFSPVARPSRHRRRTSQGHRSAQGRCGRAQAAEWEQKLKLQLPELAAKN